MTPAQVAHIMALVDAFAEEAAVACVGRDRGADTQNDTAKAIKARAAVEAALRDAPQAEPDGCTPADAAMLRRANHALAEENDALRAQQRPAIEYTPGEWFDATTVDLMEAFYLSRLPAIREAAKEHGYAIGVHGSLRRDLDLIAAPWREDASDADTLVEAIQKAACGFTQSKYQWEQKPAGRVAISVPICWTHRHGVSSDGHIDLSVLTATPSAPTAKPLFGELVAQHPGLREELLAESERADFEAWAGPITALAQENGQYVEVMTSLAWEAWQARASKGTK